MHLDGPRAGLTWPVPVDPSGAHGPTEKKARGTGWRRTSRGLYVPADVSRTVDQRIVEAAAALPSFGGLTGWAALRWVGGWWFGGDDGLSERPVTLLTGSSAIRSQLGLAVSQERVGEKEIIVTDGVRHVDSTRAVLFELRYAPTLLAAVQALDMACYSDLVSLDEMSAYVAVITGWTGIQRARDALALADENCWSPQETALRLTWTVTAKLPPALSNQPVFDRDGHHLATPDLFAPDAALALEYDGALHLQGHRRRRDRDRAELLRSHAIETLTVMSGDPRDIVAGRMVTAHRRGLATAPWTPTWTTVPPSWWVPTATVASRRALLPGQRDRWLAHRRAVS